MRALVFTALAAASCSAPCSNGTIFVALSFSGGAENANLLDVAVSLDAGPAMHKAVQRPQPKSFDSLELNFPGGYPAGRGVTITVLALSGGTVVASASGQLVAHPECSAFALALDGHAGDLAAPVDQRVEPDLAVAHADLAVQEDGAPPVVIATDALVGVTVENATAATVTITTAQPNELVLAFAAGQGPSSCDVSSMGGTNGLAWTRAVADTDTLAAIWSARAPTPLSAATVTANFAGAGCSVRLLVVSFTGASGVGATAAGHGVGTSYSEMVTTTAADSWVWAVGSDYSTYLNHSVGANQTMVDQVLDNPAGGTYWIQRQNAVTPVAGTQVAMDGITSLSQSWSLSVVEIVP